MPGKPAYHPTNHAVLCPYIPRDLPDRMYIGILELKNRNPVEAKTVIIPYFLCKVKAKHMGFFMGRGGFLYCTF